MDLPTDVEPATGDTGQFASPQAMILRGFCFTWRAGYPSLALSLLDTPEATLGAFLTILTAFPPDRCQELAMSVVAVEDRNGTIG